MYEHDTVVRHWYDKADFEVPARKAKGACSLLLLVLHVMCCT
jgi:hypothetical protein